MTDAEQREYLKRCQAGWDYLAEERRERVRAVDTAQSLRLLGRLFNAAVRQYPPTLTSGLIEQQALFMRSRVSGD